MAKITKVEQLQYGLDKLEDSLNEVIEAAEELYDVSKEFRCFGGQLKSYLIETLKGFVENENQPGSIATLQNMLNNDEEGYDDGLEYEDDEEEYFIVDLEIGEDEEE